jgi:hypothetical protein
VVICQLAAIDPETHQGPDELYYSRTSRKDCNTHTLPTFGTIGGCRQNFKALDEFDDFWSTHSLADYDNLQRDIHFNIKLDQEKTISLKPALVRELRKRARQRQTSVDALVNSISEEKLKEAA